MGGVVLTQRRLDETVPIANAAMKDRTFIEWDKDDIEELGILKIDVLALGMLTCIRKCFDLIDLHHGERLELATVPREVPEVYDMLCKGDSLGVFQVESRAQMSMLPRLRPRQYYDLVVEVAIATRPSTPTSVAEWRNAAARRFGTSARKRVKREAGARWRLTTALPQRLALGA